MIILGKLFHFYPEEYFISRKLVPHLTIICSICNMISPQFWQKEWIYISTMAYSISEFYWPYIRLHFHLTVTSRWREMYSWSEVTFDDILMWQWPTMLRLVIYSLNIRSTLTGSVHLSVCCFIFRKLLQYLTTNC